MVIKIIFKSLSLSLSPPPRSEILASPLVKSNIAFCLCVVAETIGTP